MKTEEMAKVFKALSNEQRLKLFKMIYYWSKTVSDDKECCQDVEKSFTKACECINLSRSTISHHFKELQNAGLITCTRHGQFFSCRVNKEKLEAIKKFF